MATRREKRLLVLGRLAQADAAQLSDRAIARELGVSQPFVSALRRQRDEASGEPAETLEDAAPEPSSARPGFWWEVGRLSREHTDDDVLGVAESPELARELRAQGYHYSWGLGVMVRTAFRPASEDDDGRALTDADPFR